MARVIVLLCGEEFVKNISSIADNLSGKYLLSALREAQEIHLKGVLGSALLNKCKELIAENALDEQGNENYAELVERCRYFLAYSAIAECTMKVSFKVANAGVVRITDENSQVPTLGEVQIIKKEYENKADYYCYELQKWLRHNTSLFPELSENDCSRINAYLRNSATCGLYLGGARGK